MTEPRLPVIFWEPAAKQIEDASEWWRANRPAAADALSEELGRTLALVASQPGAGMTVKSQKFREVRRLWLRRVGYYLYYRLSPGRDAIEVLAFWHARRGTHPSL